MVITTNVNMIFLGTFAAVDNDETDWTADNAESLLGTYNELEMVTVTENDVNEDGAIFDDEAQVGADPFDSLSYDVGFGPETYELDTTMAFTARLLLGDGSTMDVTVGVLQTTVGDVFIRDAGNVLDNLNIQSIQLIGVQSTNFSGSNTGNSVENSSFVCLCGDALIDTASGPKLMRDLRMGDRVRTLDRGQQPIRQIVRCRVPAPSDQAPIRIKAGALGAGQPATALRLSPQHRVLLRSRIAARMFGTPEIVVAAKHLTALPGIVQEDGDQATTYYHIRCDQHELVMANGVWVETLLVAAQSVAILSDRLPPIRPGSAPVRPIVKRRQAARLLARHRKNGHDLLERPQNAADAASGQPCTLV